MDSILKALGVVFLTIFMVMVFALIWAVTIWWSWNELMPHLFGLPNINFSQAFAFSILTGSFGGRQISPDFKEK